MLFLSNTPLLIAGTVILSLVSICGRHNGTISIRFLCPVQIRVTLLIQPTHLLSSVHFPASLQYVSIFRESFETDGNPEFYTTSIQECSGPKPYKFFTRSNGSNIGGYFEVKDQDGSYFFSSSLDESPETLIFETIDIDGYENLEFSGLFAKSFLNEWDPNDSVKIECSIDDG